MRQCAVSRERLPKGRLLRLVLSPDGAPYIDVIGRAPGRGIYVQPDPETLRKLFSPKGLGRAFRCRVTAPEPEAVEGIILDTIQRLEDRIFEMVGIARRAGLLELGMDAVVRGLDSPVQGAWILFRSEDLGAVTSRKLDERVARARARGFPLREIRLGKKQDLGSKLGRDEVGVVAIRPSRHADRMASEVDRYHALRAMPESPEIPLTENGRGEQSIFGAEERHPAGPRRGE